MIAVVDNYDSFTYNIKQYLAELTPEPILVVRNDEMTPAELLDKKPGAIIISPGPGRPAAALGLARVVGASLVLAALFTGFEGWQRM
ncbi:MAG: hypothetical protein HC897_17130 [Thermoanaerobaculia bacterium]|nr:hypothetical protein [Thermoanaerobaculia bacterium]